MIDFTQARKNMIDCQVATMGVVDPLLLDVLRAVPRERFVPDGKRDLAYIDEDLPLGQGSFLMEPLTFARLVQAAAPRPADSVLIVGDSTGYPAAVLARLVNKVVVAEAFHGQTADARPVWSELGDGNIFTAPGGPAQGCTEYAPYTLIFINGSVAAVPPSLLDQLAPNGRLVTVLRKSEIQDGRAVLVEKLDNGTHSSKILFDAGTPFVTDLAPKRAFVF